MKTFLTIMAIQVALATSAIAGPGDRGGNGGKGYVISNQLYLLELVEHGLQNKVATPVDARERDLQESADWPRGPHQYEVFQEVMIRDSKGVEKVYQVHDFEGLTTFHALMKKSTEANDWLFGRELGAGECASKHGQGGTRLPCYSESALLSALLSKKLVGGQLSSNNSYPVERFLEKFGELNWFLVDAPLAQIDDERSTIEGPKYMLAARVDRDVAIHRAGFSNATTVKGKQVQPLDFWNRAALITHEVFGAITNAQGDLTSDRSKLANASFWAQYSPESEVTSVNEILMERPVTPAKPGETPFFLSRLQPGRVIRVLRTLPMEKAWEALALTRGLPGMADDALYEQKPPSTAPVALLFADGAGFRQGHPVPAGTLLRVLKVKAEAVSTSRYGTQYVTTLTFVTDGDPDRIKWLWFYGQNGGGSPGTLAEFEAATRHHFKLLP